MESRKNILYSRASQSLFTTAAPMRVRSPIGAIASRNFSRPVGKLVAYAQPRTSSQGATRTSATLANISMSTRGMNEPEVHEMTNAFNRVDIGHSAGLQAQSKRPLAIGALKSASEAGSMANLEQRNKFVSAKSTV